jgi:hypothetical protein
MQLYLFYTLILLASWAVLTFRYRKEICLIGVQYKVEIMGMGLISLLYLVLNAPVLFGDSFRVVHDNWKYAFPFFHLFLQNLSQAGELPYWNSFVNAGEPSFLFLNHNYLLHLPHVFAYLIYPLIKGFVSTMQVYWWTIVMENYLLGLGIFFLVRVLWGKGPSSTISFAICLFSGISVGVLHQEQINAAMFYIPWFFTFAILYYRSHKPVWWFLSCLFAGYSLINSYPHLVIYFCGVVFLCGLFYYKPQKQQIAELFRCLGWKKGFIGIMIAIMMALPTVFIFLEYSPLLASPYRSGEAGQLEASYNDILQSINTNSFNLHTLFHYFFPKTFDTFFLYLGQWHLDNFPFYIGILPLFFVGYGLIKGTHKQIKFWFICLLIILFLGIGGHSFGYFLLYKFVPFSNLQRIPLHLADFINICLVLLAAGGLKQLWDKQDGLCSEIKEDGRSWLSRNVLFFFLAVVIFYGIFNLFYWRSEGLLSGLIYKEEILDALKKLLKSLRIFLDETVIFCVMVIGFVWLCKRTRNRKWVIVLFILLIFDLGRYYHLTLQKQKEPFPVSIVEIQQQNLRKWMPSIMNSNELMSGKELLLETSYQGQFIGVPVFDVFDLGRKNLVAFRDFKNFIAQNRALLQEQKSNRDFLQRVYLLPQKRGDDLYMLFREVLRDATITAKGSYSVVSHSANAVRFKISLKQPAVFVFVDNYDRGWNVQVDGVSRSLLKVGPFKGIDVLPENQEIEFIYQPAWRWSIHLTLHLFFLVGGGCMIWTYRDWLFHFNNLERSS